MNTQKNEETSSIVQPQILRPSLLIITQRLDNKPTTTDRPDKMHVSGKRKNVRIFHFTVN